MFLLLLVNTSIMIQSLRTSTPGVKQVWLADDSKGGGQIVPLYNWYNHLSQEGKKYGYLVNGSKSWPCKKNENRSLFGVKGGAKKKATTY